MAETVEGMSLPAGEIGALLIRIAADDRQAFELLYARTSAKLFGICLRILASREEAEETLQEIYVSIWHRAGRYRPERGEGMAWLMVLARNRAIDRLRMRRPVPSAPLSLGEAVPDPAPLAPERLDQRQVAGRLARCLEGLAGDDATLIRAAFFGGNSYSDLAEHAALPLGTVKSRIRRALIRLRECLR